MSCKGEKRMAGGVGTMKCQFKRMLFVAFLITVLVVPGSGVLQEITYRGTVTGLDQANETITIQVSHTWGCTFGNTTTCEWDPIPEKNLTGTVPVPEVFSVVSPGMTVEATSIGGPGGRWIGIGTLFPTPGIEYWIAQDLFGDPSVLPAPLMADFDLNAETIPDCLACSATVCTARNALVNVSQIEGGNQEVNVSPGQTFTFSERNDNSSLTVVFLHGEASASGCPGAEPLIGGIQPVSDFIVHIQPPMAFVPPTEATTATPSPTSSPTAGACPVLSLAGLAIFALLLFVRRPGG
jgi:hypothetical protein